MQKRIPALLTLTLLLSACSGNAAEAPSESHSASVTYDVQSTKI